MSPFPRSSRLRDWLARWGAILPLLAAEFIAWVGFGALLPVMPLYFREHGLDLATLGIVIAAWPAARLVGEPIFGWLADRTARVPIMVLGLAGTGIAVGMPLVLVGPVPFLLFRALAGLATAAYDPAARGYLTDATPRERRGEAFGLYGAAQMGGLLLGPAIGGLGAAAFGGFEFVFVFGSVGTLVAAAAVALRVRETPAAGRHRVGLGHDLSEFPAESPHVYERAADDLEGDVDGQDDATGAARPGGEPGTGEGPPAPDAAGRADGRWDQPRRLWNRRLVAALVLNVGGYFAGGTYEVIWSLFLESKGAGLDLIGLTFAMFALPVLLFSPLAGRWVDRRGSYGFIVFGGLAAAGCSVAYTVVGDVLLVIPILWLEATGFALLNPALYAVVASGSPRGRSSTAQGIYGAAGTVGTIAASIVAGQLASVDLRYPFWVGAVVMTACLLVGLAVGGRSLRIATRRPPRAATP